jgi:phosphatidylglycerophosphatase A
MDYPAGPIRTLARLVASGCGLGFAPVAPGTVASAFALLPGVVLLDVCPTVLPLSALLTALAGLWALRAEKIEGDPSWVVIDEIAGQLLALCGLSYLSLPGVIAAFVIFRLLDVVKPGPIGWADRQRGAPGIMGDDLIAGAIAAGIVWAVESHGPSLFG